MRSALGRGPHVGNTTQSTRCESWGTSTTLNFCRSPGCRHGFLVTNTSVLMSVLGSPSPSNVMRTKQVPGRNSPGPSRFVGSHTPNNKRDSGIMILHRCSSLLFNILEYSSLTILLILPLTASMPSMRIFSANLDSSCRDANRKPAWGSPFHTVSKNFRCCACFRSKTSAGTPSECNSNTISSFK